MSSILVLVKSDTAVKPFRNNFPMLVISHLYVTCYCVRLNVQVYTVKELSVAKRIKQEKKKRPK